ncbi:hypothetical protein Cantr_09760 [Candida viswanathii]|uniref:Uncharacterized protein n=1 Tax=Candida viswanathii TaxID=5486 RepID=A0A367YBK8_9ASCO|nr:hypothetical protein Cantr_09760 [Candida viswanathii]
MSTPYTPAFDTPGLTLDDSLFPDDAEPSDDTLILEESEPESEAGANHNNQAAPIIVGSSNSHLATNSPPVPESGEPPKFGDVPNDTPKPKKTGTRLTGRRELTAEKRIYLYGFQDGMNLYQRELEKYYESQLVKIRSDPMYASIRTKLKGLVKPPKISLDKQSEAAGCKSSTFRDTIKRRKLRPTGQSLERSGPKNRKISKEIEPSILEYVKANPRLSHKDIIQHFGIQASTATLKRFLKVQGYEYDNKTKSIVQKKSK